MSHPGSAGNGDRPGPRQGQARPDYHDPTAGFGGAPRSQSALTLRLLLAGFGLVVCAGAAIWMATIDRPVYLVAIFALLALVAAVDLVVVARRKGRGEPG